MKKKYVIVMYISLAVVLSALETVLLPSSIIPGVKLGFANLVVITALYQFGYIEAVIVSVFRVLIVSLILATLFTPTFVISLSGMVFALVATFVAFKVRVFSCIGVSVVSSVAHIVGQVIAVIYISDVSSMIMIAPYLVYLAIISGTVIGYVASKVLKAVSKTMEVKYEF